MPKKTIDQPSEKIYKTRQQLFLDNLLGGIAWGVGSVIGATLVIGILGFSIAQLKTVPFLGDVVAVIIHEITQYQDPFSAQ